MMHITENTIDPPAILEAAILAGDIWCYALTRTCSFSMNPQGR